MPIKKAKKALSGQTTAQRLRQVEKASTPAKKKKAKPKAKVMPYKPAAKHVTARQKQIDAQRKRDEKAIAARRKKKK